MSDDLTVTEAAARAGTSDRFMGLLLERGRIPYHEVSGERCVDAADLQAYLEEQQMLRSEFSAAVVRAREEADRSVAEAAGGAYIAALLGEP